MYVFVYMLSSTCVKVGGQFMGICFLLPPYGLQDQIQAVRLGDKHLYLLSHLLTDCRYLIAVNFILNS